jgi:hypothetical protein
MLGIGVPAIWSGFPNTVETYTLAGLLYALHPPKCPPTYKEAEMVTEEYGTAVMLADEAHTFVQIPSI